MIDIQAEHPVSVYRQHIQKAGELYRQIQVSRSRGGIQLEEVGRCLLCKVRNRVAAYVERLNAVVLAAVLSTRTTPSGDTAAAAG